MKVGDIVYIKTTLGGTHVSGRKVKVKRIAVCNKNITITCNSLESFNGYFKGFRKDSEIVEYNINASAYQVFTDKEDFKKAIRKALVEKLEKMKEEIKELELFT